MATTRRRPAPSDDLPPPLPIPPPTAGELAQHRRVVDEVTRIHEEIGPIHGLTLAELLADEDDERSA